MKDELPKNSALSTQHSALAEGVNSALAEGVNSELAGGAYV